MNTPRQAARQRRQRRKLVLGGTSALIAVGVLAYLVMALLPDRNPDAAPAAATPLATSQVKASASAGTGTPTAKASPTGSSSPTGSASPKGAANSTSARPSPTNTPRSGQKSATTPQAGRLQPHTTYQGVATAYEAADGNGACLFGPSPDLMIAAMNTTDYETSKACGAYVLVRAANGKSITVRITNECPLPCAPGQLDLSQQAFAKLADLTVGRIPITWSLVSPSTSGTISMRYKTGSSAYWCAIQAIGHRNPVTRLEVRTSGGWRQLPRTAYNYFLSADGSGCGGAIRLTDIYGERLTITGIAVRPNVVQPTGVQFARH
ncbi:expansin EXLX1 family cellulose-binding protein [Streptomyces sp. NBC_00078]|uniref:expansin EXLX1 family cellulose-binding protein n=1 Tax=unclassified Streptomyces TaxID=2593676 RepID=UPI00225AA26B|nr:expansin EXLX1 family cellulose-binding protein [Streptomyces sp. NBC_00078]MCX5419033.1 RlpA-like double-psi beta-barrel domain-containing protein [Streptomyces sp. NBC_00078]